MPLADRRGVRDVIPMPVGQHEHPYLIAREGLVRPLWRVEKNQSARRFRGKAVRLVWSSGESFELHGLQSVEGRELIFLAQPVFQGNQL